MPAKPEARRILFLQVANPAAYPPTIHAARIMAAAGWRVTLLSAPIKGSKLSMDLDPGVELRSIAARPSHVISRVVYLRYLAAAARLALRQRPDVVYASDPFSAGPGIMAANLAGARLVYHEHDSPQPGAPATWIARLRRAAARKAELVVLPNEGRAAVVSEDLGVAEKTLTVWNLPSRRELPCLPRAADDRLELYYHGSITPERLPEAVAHALAKLGGQARLSIAGYEAPGARGYVERLLGLCARPDGPPLARYLGEIPRREDLLAQAAQAHVGLSFMPYETDDVNMHHMIGASNKAFDYMAAGLALLVSDLPDWRATFVAPGYALACDPANADSVAVAVKTLLDDPAARRQMAARARAKIEDRWTYEAAFAPVLAALSDG
jgi:glycosyltransferase involved in cell wall biosynthesis